MHLFSLGWVIAITTLLTGAVAPAAAADEPIPFSRVMPLFETHCHKCHGIEKPKGDFRIDKLNPDFIQGRDGDHWRDVMDRLNFGDMPPEKEPPLKIEERELMASWIVQERRRASLVTNQPAAFRRLTRLEYEQTMRELLGLPIEFASRLPEDGKSKDGFHKDGDVLRMSPLQYETYLQIADEALAQAIVTGSPPVVHRYRITVDRFKVEALPKPDDRPGESYDYRARSFRIDNQSKLDNGVLPPSEIERSREAAVKLPKNRFALRIQQSFPMGEAMIRVHAARVDSNDSTQVDSGDSARAPVLTVALGTSNYHGVELKTIGEPIVIDHTDFRTYEIRFRMENFSVPNAGPLNDRNSTIMAAWNSAMAVRGESQPPKLKIEWIEFEDPFLESWPPPSHTNILFERKDLGEKAYAREVLRRFAARAYRAPLTPGELDRLESYWTKARQTSDSLEASLRDTLAVVLSSPRFLGLPVNRAGGVKEKLTDYELASRLSYFLWSTMPDDEMMRLAEEGKLREPGVLSTQIRRMIKDPRAWSFIEQFSEQWLDLERLEKVSINRKDYPSFNADLAAFMRLETIHFFGEVLRENLSIFQFIDSDFTCVNDVLAGHYGIKGVIGPAFRKVQLDPSLHRGGLLTQSSILTGLSDGRDGHPIKRGVWLLRNLFNEPPPPPPPNVPELDREQPKLKNLTIPQALAAHRDSESCLNCHRRIDPWGIAFEEYDAIGNWQRDGEGASLRRKRTQQPIESAAVLPNGVEISGMETLRKELVRTKANDFRKAMIHKVMAYALGRTLTLSDSEAADALVPTLRAREDRLASLIELIVASEPFQSK